MRATLERLKALAPIPEVEPAEMRPRMTREELEARLPPPCCYCGEREKLVGGVYRITHRYELHPGVDTLKPRSGAA